MGTHSLRLRKAQHTHPHPEERHTAKKYYSKEHMLIQIDGRTKEGMSVQTGAFFLVSLEPFCWLTVCSLSNFLSPALVYLPPSPQSGILFVISYYL